MTYHSSASRRLIVVAGVGTVALLFLRYLSTRGGYDYSDAYAPPASATASDHRSDDHPLREIDDEHEATTTKTKTTNESDVVSVTSGSLTTLTGLLRDEDEDGREAPSYEAEEVPWYHCGPAYGRTPTSDRPSSSSVVEVLLLRGASFTHEHWRESGILEALCRADPALSVTAADLRTVGAARPAAQLVGLARALSDAEGLTTGAPLVVVSPSASGKDVVALAARHDDDASSLRTVVRAWVPVASPAIKTTSETVLKRFANENVPVLALHGTTDSMGAKVSAKLRTFADAEVSTFEGGHAGYFQQQEDFVDQLVTFLHKLS